MKKYSFLIGSTILLSLLTFYACQKDTQNDVQQNAITNTTQGMPTAIDQVVEDNCDKMVHTAALGIMELSKNPSFRALVHDKCSEMFDNDYNVLLKDLKNPAQDMGINMNESFANSISNNVENINSSAVTIPYGYYTDGDHIDQAITGYDYYDKKCYLQLYVPNMEDPETESDTPKAVNNEQPIIVVLPEDLDEDEPGYGYILQEDGTFKTEMITKDFLDQNLIWVVSINESVNNEGIYVHNVDNNVIQTKKSDYKDKGLPQASERGTRVAKSAVLTHIQINARNESWLSGRVDVDVVFAHLKACKIIQLVSKYRIGQKTDGTWNHHENNRNTGKAQLTKLKTKKLKELLSTSGMDNIRYFALYYYALGYEPNIISALESEEDIAFVIYESDVRRKFEKSYQAVCGGDILADPIYYISKQDPYLAKGYSWYDMPNYAPSVLDSWNEHFDNDILGNQGVFRISGKRQKFDL